MCGIAGFHNGNEGLNHQEMMKLGISMHEAIAHRGPDAKDVWKDPDTPLVLAHRRLSIIDLSPEGNQPMTSHSGRYVIAYNGEIYDYLDIRAELEEAGHSFRGRSDTEVMLTAFDHWGVNQGLQKMNGMFAIALWDRQNKQLHLIRDRFGKKPLYVGWAGKSFVFGSELKVFHAHPDFVPEVNRNALALYTRYASMPAPFTIFENVWQVLPGARMTLNIENHQSGDNLAEKMESYWFPPRVMEEAQAKGCDLNETGMIETFEERFRRAVEMRMISDVPLGAFLSGGIDSSAVVALMQQISSQPVKTFSIGFEEEAYNEAQHAKVMAEHLGTEHHEFYVTGQDALNVVPNLPDIYDEPFADQSQIPTHLISKLARDHVTVVLTGDGGDEMLGGYNRHTYIPAAWRKIGWIPHGLRQMASGAVRSIPAHFLDRLKSNSPHYGRRIHQLAGLVGLKNTEDIYAYVIGQWQNPEDLVIRSKEPLIPLHDPAWQPQNLNFTERMIYGDILSYRSNDLMTKIDRAGMAVALEARAPLMDYELTEFCWRLPLSVKVRGTTGKWLLRQVLKRYVPESLYERPKMGFGIPLDDWLRGPLKEWSADLLNENTLKDQGFFDPALVQKAWNEHQSGVAVDSHAGRLWAVLMFQAWHARWIKN